MKYYRSYKIKTKNRTHYKVVKEIIRIADAEKEEYQYAKSKFENKIDFINLKAREAFPNGVSIVILKYCYGFNIIEVRGNIINKSTTIKDYP